MNPKSPAFMILFGVSLIAAGGNTALQSVLPNIGREFGLADTLVTGAFAISALMWTVTSPFWARLSDRMGRKKVILIGLGGFCLSMLGFGLATTSGLMHWMTPLVAFGLMALARTIYGVFGSAAPIAAQAYVADRTTREGRTQALSLLASAQGLGTVVGPVAAPLFILPVVGLAGPMYAFGLFAVAMLAIVWLRLPSGDVVRQPASSNSAARKGPGLWKDPRIRDILLFGLLATSVQAINISVLGFHIIDVMGESGVATREAQSFIAIAMLAGAASTLMAQWGLIPLLKLQPRALMIWGAAFALAGNLVSILADGYYGVVVGYAIVSLGLGFARPGFTAGASIAVNGHEQGAVAGLIMSLAGLSFLAPPVIGVGLYQIGEMAPFIANAVLMAGAVALCFLSPALKASVAIAPTEAPPEAKIAPPASQPGPEGGR